MTGTVCALAATLLCEWWATVLWQCLLERAGEELWVRVQQAYL
jgi:hypothetical protein